LHGLHAAANALDLGNSGTGMRLLAGLLAGQRFGSTLTGDASLRVRPMERVAAPLREMGAAITTTDGCAPIQIYGCPLHAIDFRSPVASAQLKSALLLAGLYATGTTRVTEPGITRDHTERMLQAFGADIQFGAQWAAVNGPAQLRSTAIEVPGDLSSAAFVLAAGLLAGDDTVVVERVGINPTRTGILDILRLMGAEIEIRDAAETGHEPIATLIARRSQLHGATIPPELVPLAIDELPMIFALAACAEGETVVTGAAELRVKESDRIAVMARGLHALGIATDEFPDGIRIGGGTVKGGRVHSHGDHRIAMAFSVLGLAAGKPVTILDTANVATSFPGYPDLMRSIGLDIRESTE
jgi:3-phosphoshikimate 1-carboxyvinyltransferase